MSSTDDATRFYAEYLLPLKRVNDRRGVRYFTTAADPTQASYWEAPISRSGGIQALDRAACDGAALIQQLGAHWTASGQAPLTRMLDGLEALRSQQMKPAAAGEAQAPLTDFIYPLH